MSKTHIYLIAVNDGGEKLFINGPYPDDTVLIDEARTQRKMLPGISLYSLEFKGNMPYIAPIPDWKLRFELEPFIVMLQPDDPEREPRFLNHYRCPVCGEDWEDTWDSGCDDECPACGTVTSPHASQELEVRLECFECDAVDSHHAIMLARKAKPCATVVSVIRRSESPHAS